MPTPQVSVIVPVFNQWAFTAQSLRSLKEHTPQSIQVIVIDNASKDQTVSDLDILGKELWNDSFTSVHLPENQGFARASNLGARLAQADILFFLNNDTLLTPNWLPPLLEALDADAGLGAVGPLLLFPSGLVQHLGLTFLPGPGVNHLYDSFPHAHPLVTKARQPKAMTAAALCMPKQVFLSANGFFEGYLNGCEDIDLCLTLGQQGHHFRCVPESAVMHFTSKTEGRFRNDIPNSELLVSRHAPRLMPDIHLHAHADGYEICLNEWLLPLFCLTPERNMALMREAEVENPQKWFDLLEGEPLWNHGYDLLANWLESRQSFQDALTFRTLAAHFHPDRTNLLKLLKTAQNAMAEQIVLATLADLDRTSELSCAAHQEAQARVEWATLSAEPFWKKLYTEWLAASPNRMLKP
jgi:GT2 family glycosyltransferase